jgi:hypothetical protein
MQHWPKPFSAERPQRLVMRCGASGVRASSSGKHVGQIAPLHHGQLAVQVGKADGTVVPGGRKGGMGSCTEELHRTGSKALPNASKHVQGCKQRHEDMNRQRNGVTSRRQKHVQDPGADNAGLSVSGSGVRCGEQARNISPRGWRISPRGRDGSFTRDHDTGCSQGRVQHHCPPLCDVDGFSELYVSKVQV